MLMYSSATPSRFCGMILYPRIFRYTTCQTKSGGPVSSVRNGRALFVLGGEGRKLTWDMSKCDPVSTAIIILRASVRLMVPSTHTRSNMPSFGREAGKKFTPDDTHAIYAYGLAAMIARTALGVGGLTFPA